MTSSLESKVLRLEDDGYEMLQRVRNRESRLDELEERSRGEIGESLVEPDLAHRESDLAAREEAVAAREEAVKAREEQYARAVDAWPLPPPHPKDAWLTERANGGTYAQFIAAGWTDELLEQHRIMVVPRPVREAIQEFKLQNGVDGVFA